MQKSSDLAESVRESVRMNVEASCSSSIASRIYTVCIADYHQFENTRSRKVSTMPEWYLYMVRCRNGHLYTGITTEVERRLADHQASRGAKYLRGRGPLKLVLKKRIGEKGMALKIEKLIKKLSKKQKEQLIKDPVRVTHLFKRVRSKQ